MSAETKAMLSQLIDRACTDVENLKPLFEVPDAEEMTRYQTEALRNVQEAHQAAYVALKAARAEFP